MNFTKVKIPNRDNKMVKYQDLPYPQPKKNSGLPRNFFIALAVGSRGSGKTVSVVKLIKYYEKEGVYSTKGEKVPIRTIIFSPTFESNPIFKTLKSLDIENDVHSNYSDKLLLKVLEQIHEEKEEIERYQEKLQLYKKYLKIKKMTDLTPMETFELQSMDFRPPVKVCKYDHPPVINMILDDLVGSNGAFKSLGASAINNLVIKNRHIGINVFILAQSLKQIPKIVRINSSVLLLYKFNSNKVLEDIYEVVSGVLTIEQFYSLFNEATKERYNFLNVDTTQNGVLIKQNFDHQFILNNEK